MVVRPTFIQIVSALPPSTSGVGDYALKLACQMRSDFAVETCFIVGDSGWQGPAQVEGFAARRLAERSAESLAALLLASTHGAQRPRVLLQLSGYGYSRRGCPFWLLEGLRRWKAQQPDGQLVTMFHELYASAPPWRKTFWFGYAQKFVVKELARLSDIAVTNIALYRERLERLDVLKAAKITTLAVPSNVGEPAAPAELIAREKSLVVFGLAGSRQRTYELRKSALHRACQELGIEKVHDIGPEFAGIPDRIGGVPVTRHGRMDGCELSALLGQAMAGFIDYCGGYLGKSGIFAAYCAHRLLPLTPQGGCSEEDGLRSGVQYCSMDANTVIGAVRGIQAVADAAWEWYLGHCLKEHAALFAACSKEGNPTLDHAVLGGGNER